MSIFCLVNILSLLAFEVYYFPLVVNNEKDLHFEAFETEVTLNEFHVAQLTFLFCYRSMFNCTVKVKSNSF